MEYPVKEGKYGLIYTIADGLRVTQTKYGTWQLSLKHGIMRKRRNFNGEDAMQKALRAGELLAAKLDIIPDGKKLNVKTVSHVSEEWLAANRIRWTEGTYERYYTIARDFLIPVIGEFPIASINRNRIKDLLVDILAIRSPKTVELVHAVISGIFSEAIDRGYTNENPASKLLRKILPAKNKRNLRKPDPFPRADLEKVLLSAWDRLPTPFGLILEILAYSGMRLGECLAMHTDHLDILNCQYMVSETTKRGRFGLPKTGTRLIDLPESLVLKVEKYVFELRKKAFSEGKTVGYLFPDITQRLVQGALKRVCRFAKVRTRRPHDLRHSYATILLMEHYSPVYVQKQLGHHSITMTVDTYGHWIPGEGKKDLDRALRGTVKGHGPREESLKNEYLTRIK